jgi:hypothetical protein
MSIHAIGGALPNLGIIRDPHGSEIRRPGSDRPADAPATQTQARPAPAAVPARAAAALPVEAPPGTDPELWSVLTVEERGFFARSAARGPLSYGPTVSAPRPEAAVARGVRLDVRA